MVFLVMNSIHTWKSPRVMRTTTHHVERFLRMPSNSNDIEKRNGEEKGIRCSRLTTTQNSSSGYDREKVLIHQNFTRCSAKAGYPQEARGQLLEGDNYRYKEVSR